MKAIFTSLLALIALTISAQTTILQENFTSYAGTAGTVPAGWTFSYNGNYTTAASSGISGPNSYKFGANAASITTPSFTAADTVSFWIKGISTDAVSSFSIEQSPDNVSWSLISNIVPLPTTGTTQKLPVSTGSKYLRFTFNKSAGNLAFDDFLLTHAASAATSSSSKIKVYFNHPVNNAVSQGVNAVYLNQTLDDTLIAYINRAKYTLDIAVYNYIQTSGISNIATAINSAYSRGVAIRWIYNGSSSNSGLSSINSSIQRLASPTTSAYNIMHNKFMIVDANSSNTADPIVWTGSCNWDEEQFNLDVNNTIIIQDKALALAYTTEFNEMWGGTGLSPNTTNSKFGPFKTNNTPHTFTVGGKTIESYFSPSDGTNSHIQSSIRTANYDLYFGVYTFTDSNDADSIKAKKVAGVYTAGIMDQYSQTFTPYTTLSAALGTKLKVYTQSTSIFHDKLLIVDPCHPSSDPLVLTGSHNWTASADTKNDENTLIVHDDTVANLYYQSFYQNFADLGGSVTPQCLTTGLQDQESESSLWTLYPNPNNGTFYLDGLETDAVVEVYNINGQFIMKHTAENEHMALDMSNQANGIYIIRITGKLHTATGRFCKE
ncbi:MAG: T9SS type A sorting domain-containing protein [Bacteroidetes bacterium]|nr:T9SS type A sorting domain-containing protein [Bacteroidota bacterium]